MKLKKVVLRPDVKINPPGSSEFTTMLSDTLHGKPWLDMIVEGNCVIVRHGVRCIRIPMSSVSYYEESEVAEVVELEEKRGPGRPRKVS